MTVDLSKLATYAGQREKALILQVLLGLTAAKDVTLMQGIKSSRQLTKLTTASVARPFTSTFGATDSSLAFSDREIRTRLGKGEWLINTTDFYNSWLEENLPNGFPDQTKEAVPFSKYVFEQIIKQLATDINLNTIYSGVYNAAGTTAKDIADGFGTILAAEIAANKFVPTVTGSLATDAVAKVEALYKAHDAKYREMEMVAYMSYASYDYYTENYRSRFGANTITDTFLQKAIEHSNGKCKLKPVLWMGNSGRVIITPKENLIIGTDRESDMHKLNTLPRMWALEVGAAFNIGCQFRDLEVMKTNDVA